jgi:hypothetical protein
MWMIKEVTTPCKRRMRKRRQRGRWRWMEMGLVGVQIEDMHAPPDDPNLNA